MKKRLIYIAMLAGLLAQPFLSALAQDLPVGSGYDAAFDPDRVLDDDDIFDVNGMSYDRMVTFLRAKGTLADHVTPDTDGVPKKVPEILYRVATSYKINPKYLMALIQKEQSLVEDPHPSQKQFDWATGYGVCDNCSKDDPSIQDFKGFASQVEWAAKQYREKYLLQILGTGRTRAGKAPGLAMLVDSHTVTPENNATAMLYAYTPHISGNYNLWRIWQRWFSLNFPEGTVVRGKTTNKTYLIRLGQKRPFDSLEVLMSMVDQNKIIPVSDTELDGYPLGPSIRFPNYALLRDDKKRLWLLSGNTRRRIADMKAFRKFGFNEDEIIDVKSDELDGYEDDGRTITTKTEFPTGIVMQDSKDKTLWYVEQGSRSLIPDKTFLSLYFRGRVVKKVTAKTLAKYAIGEPYRLHDGELVRKKSDPAVFVVENGALRLIPTSETFESIGWKWKNVLQLPDRVLAEYPIGDPVSAQRPDMAQAPSPADASGTLVTL